MHTHIEVNILLCLCCCLNTKSWTPSPQLLTLNPQQCPGEVKPKPEHGELSQLLNLSTHSQRSPLKINHMGKPPCHKPPRRMRATHASRSAGSSAENFPLLLFHGADVRMAAAGHVDVSFGNADTQVVARRGERQARKHLSPAVKITSNYFTRLTNKSLKPRLCNTRMINVNKSYDSNWGVEG